MFIRAGYVPPLIRLNWEIKAIPIPTLFFKERENLPVICLSSDGCLFLSLFLEEPRIWAPLCGTTTITHTYRPQHFTSPFYSFRRLIKWLWRFVAFQPFQQRVITQPMVLFLNVQTYLIKVKPFFLLFLFLTVISEQS